MCLESGGAVVDQNGAVCWSRQREDDTWFILVRLRGQREEQTVEEGQRETCQSCECVSIFKCQYVWGLRRGSCGSVGTWSWNLCVVTLTGFLVSQPMTRGEEYRDQRWHAGTGELTDDAWDSGMLNVIEKLPQHLCFTHLYLWWILVFIYLGNMTFSDSQCAFQRQKIPPETLQEIRM